MALVLGTVSPAEAARSGGRVGGSSFSSRSYSGSSRSYSSPSYSSRSSAAGSSYSSRSTSSSRSNPSGHTYSSPSTSSSKSSALGRSYSPPSTSSSKSKSSGRTYSPPSTSSSKSKSSGRTYSSPSTSSRSSYFFEQSYFPPATSSISDYPMGRSYSPASCISNEGYSVMPTETEPIEPKPPVLVCSPAEQELKDQLTPLATYLIVVGPFCLYCVYLVAKDKRKAEQFQYDYLDSTLAKVQVGLRGPTNALKHDLDALTAGADTSTPQGLHQLLQGTIRILLRSDCIVCGASESDLEDKFWAKLNFFRTSTAERTKVLLFTFTNWKGVMSRLKFSNSPPSTEPEEAGVDELMVVTIVVVVAAPLQLAPIRTPGDAKSCLQALGEVKRSKVEALQVTWTP